MKKNVANKKTINNIKDFSVVFNGLTVSQKVEVLKNIDTTLTTGKSPNGLQLKDSEKIALAGLQSWCMVNLMVGDDLCPPSALLTYIKN